MKVALNQVLRCVHPRDLPSNIERDPDGYLNWNFLLSNGGVYSPGNIQRPMFWHVDTKICCPAIYFHTNPFRTDRKIKPWTDVILQDQGFAYYNGDNRTPGLLPSGKHNSGNKKMEKVWGDYFSHDIAIREKAPPIIMVEQTRVAGASKGYRRFIGFGIVTKVDVRQEFDVESDGVFSNYLFEVSLFKVPPSGLDWQWIYDRRNPNISVNAINKNAPKSWKRWVQNGMSEVDKIRQTIRHYEISTPTEQVAELGSSHREILDAIVSHYPKSTDKGRFESLASLVASEFFGEHYSRGWITKHSGDMGVDFIGRLEIKNQHAPAPPGTVLGGATVLVFGQAKCRTNYETAAEDANAIARVAARLQRGYLGVFVTTGTYKLSTQKEVAIDGYPIVLINGRQLADLIIQYSHRTGKKMQKILSDCDQWYHDNQRDVPPENFLRD